MTQEDWDGFRSVQSVTDNIPVVENQRVDGKDEKDPKKDQPFFLARYVSGFESGPRNQDDGNRDRRQERLEIWQIFEAKTGTRNRA